MSEDKEFDTSFNPDFAICPYCGYEEQDSWELSDGEHDCSDCGKTFLVTIDTTVYYTTTKIEEDTQEEEEVPDD